MQRIDAFLGLMLQIRGIKKPAHRSANKLLYYEIISGMTGLPDTGMKRYKKNIAGTIISYSSRQKDNSVSVEQ